MPEKIAIPGSERSEIPGATLLGPVPDDERLSASIAVRQRPDGPARAAELGQAAKAPEPYLSNEEFTAVYRADDADVAAVAEFARGQGFTVESASSPLRTVRISGTARQFQDVFGTSLRRYQYQGETFRGRTGPLYVPAGLAPLIDGVFGIDDRPIARSAPAVASAGIAAPPAGDTVAVPAAQTVSGSNQYDALDVAAAYDFPRGVNGTGQTIAIVTLLHKTLLGLGPYQGGYLASDLTSYFSELGLATPTVVNVSVGGASNNPQPAPAPGATDYDLEVTTDIEIAGAVAQGASIVVYFAPNTSSGWLAVLQAILNDTTNNPSVISISYAAPETSATSWTSALIGQIEALFAAAAAKGITVLAASGDAGSSCGLTDGLAHVEYPASSPGVTSCGGTVLTLVSGSYSSEVTWDTPGHGATGGGVSSVFPAPAWQTAAGVVPVSANPGGGQGRGVPDVCGHADNFKIFLRGEQTGAYGTSAGAPLWAGLVALINQQLGRRAGALNPSIYKLGLSSSFRDVAAGTNGAYNAGPGWDPCTGWGSPVGAQLATALNGLVPPVVTAIAPSLGPETGGTSVTITGNGFANAVGVQFGSADATALPDVSNTQITAISPAGTGLVDVTVITAAGQSAASTASQFTYLPVPVVTSL